MEQARHALYMVRVKVGSDRRVGLLDMVSGALLVNLVDRATVLAIRAAVAGGPKGIEAAHLVAAVKDLPAQLKSTNVDDLIETIAAGELGGKDNVKRVDPL